jgi:lipopolysaccharide biosynthesis glycosyltransferase
MAKLFSEINFTFYNFDDVSYGDDIALLAHISVSTMDRLFLPEILKDLDKVVYLDIDILIQGDVGYLYDLELGENVFAGKRTKLKTWANMIRPITRATLKFEPAKAWDIRRRLHSVADLTSRTFNAGILSLNLRLMREENFTVTHMYLVEQCKMNDQDVFNIYSRNRVVEIGTEWNHVPSQDFNAEPKIIHWAGPAKPWLENYVLLKERFETTKKKVEARLLELK